MYCTTNPKLIAIEVEHAKATIRRIAERDPSTWSQGDHDARSCAFATLRAYQPTERDDSGLPHAAPTN